MLFFVALVISNTSDVHQRKAFVLGDMQYKHERASWRFLWHLVHAHFFCPLFLLHHYVAKDLCIQIHVFMVVLDFLNSSILCATQYTDYKTEGHFKKALSNMAQRPSIERQQIPLSTPKPLDVHEIALLILALIFLSYLLMLKSFPIDFPSSTSCLNANESHEYLKNNYAKQCNHASFSLLWAFMIKQTPLSWRHIQTWSACFNLQVSCREFFSCCVQKVMCKWKRDTLLINNLKCTHFYIRTMQSNTQLLLQIIP